MATQAYVKTELLALAERCEKATGPDRNLDADIMRAVGWGGLKADYNPAPFTASIDSASELLPSGLFPLLDWSGPHCRLRISGGTDFRGASSLAATPALALCGAILRARAQNER